MQTGKGFSVLILAFLLVGSTCARGQLPANEIEGTWRMTSQELVYPDSVIDQSDEWGSGYKILNSTHFTWARETEDGETILAGGGRYEYFPEQDVYIEHIEFHSDPGFAGATLRFTARVEGDTWFHIGEVGEYKLREVWERVDPQQVRAELRGDTTTTGAQSADVNK